MLLMEDFFLKPSLIHTELFPSQNKAEYIDFERIKLDKM